MWHHLCFSRFWPPIAQAASSPRHPHASKQMVLHSEARATHNIYLFLQPRRHYGCFCHIIIPQERQLATTQQLRLRDAKTQALTHA